MSKSNISKRDRTIRDQVQAKVEQKLSQLIADSEYTSLKSFPYYPIVIDRFIEYKGIHNVMSGQLKAIPDEELMNELICRVRREFISYYKVNYWEFLRDYEYRPICTTMDSMLLEFVIEEFAYAIAPYAARQPEPNPAPIPKPEPKVRDGLDILAQAEFERLVEEKLLKQEKERIRHLKQAAKARQETKDSFARVAKEAREDHENTNA